MTTSYPGPDDWAVLQRQGLAAVRALMRPQTYVGASREWFHTLLHAAAYPTGVSPIDFLQPLLHADDAVGQVADGLPAAIASTPVVLVHGYLHNRSAFHVMARALHAAGFRRVHAFDYPQFALGIDEIAADLATSIERLLDGSGAQRCLVVGHSMGGIVARVYIQQLGGDETVNSLVTIGTPHQGTHTARFGVGPAARQMMVGSPLLTALEASARPGRTRYVSFYSDLDACVVPAISAKLTHPALSATNVRVADTGHLSMLLSAEVITAVVGFLSQTPTESPL